MPKQMDRYAVSMPEYVGGRFSHNYIPCTSRTQQIIKKIDTMYGSVFLSPGFAINTSYEHSYSPDTGADRFVMHRNEGDTCSRSG